MVVGKFVSKVLQSLPSWEMTKYYGRVAWFQLQCLKYRIQTSETWFNFVKKYMPGRLEYENDCESKNPSATSRQVSCTKTAQSTNTEGFEKVSTSNLLKEKLGRLRLIMKKNMQDYSPPQEEERGAIKICTKTKQKDDDTDFQKSPKPKPNN